MNVHACNGSLVRTISLCHQRSDNARQHIARATGSHTRITGAVEITDPIRQCNKGIMSFQYNNDLELLCFFESYGQAVKIIAGLSEKPFKFFGMGCKDG